LININNSNQPMNSSWYF